MRKSIYRTDYLFSRMSFVIGTGSILSIFSPYFTFNGSSTESKADRTAIESDFGVIGKDIEQVVVNYGK
ncbi:MAG: hypothetical protein MJY69_03130 [Bacteroidales bacterium]|nr:hypothetical protein [Bacteroidales bacterium]